MRDRGNANIATVILSATALATGTALFGAVQLSGGGMPGDPGGPAGQISRPPQGLTDYQQRCEDLNNHMAAARVVYQAKQDMTRGKSAVVTAAVTVDATVPAAKVLRRATAVAEEAFIVSCRLQARVRASAYDFSIDQKGWTSRSLLTTDTARWQWYVTPKTGGTHTLILELRPVVRVRRESPTGAPKTSDIGDIDTADVASYETTAHVSVPWSQRPAALMTVSAKTLGVAEGLVKSVTAMLLAVAALVGAWRVVRRRGGKRTPVAPTGAP